MPFKASNGYIINHDYVWSGAIQGAITRTELNSDEYWALIEFLGHCLEQEQALAQSFERDRQKAIEKHEQSELESRRELALIIFGVFAISGLLMLVAP